MPWWKASARDGVVGLSFSGRRRDEGGRHPIRGRDTDQNVTMTERWLERRRSLWKANDQSSTSRSSRRLGSWWSSTTASLRQADVTLNPHESGGRTLSLRRRAANPFIELRFAEGTENTIVIECRVHVAAEAADPDADRRRRSTETPKTTTSVQDHLEGCEDQVRQLQQGGTERCHTGRRGRDSSERRAGGARQTSTSRSVTSRSATTPLSSRSTDAAGNESSDGRP